MTVQIYKSEDVGAPQMAGGSLSTRGDYLAVLKACLVDGYGSKSPAGWTMPYSDLTNNIAVFRNSSIGSGTGTYYRVNDNLSGYSARVKAYRSMSGHSTGENGFPWDRSYAASNAEGLVFMKRNAVNEGQWIVIACERSAYIGTRITTTSFGNVNTGESNGVWYYNFIGDVVSHFPTDPYCGGLFGLNTDDDSPSTTYFGSGYNLFECNPYDYTPSAFRSFLLSADYDGSGLGVNYRGLLYCNIDDTEFLSGGNQMMESPSPVDGSIEYCKYYLGMYGDDTLLNTRRGFRANLPGALAITQQAYFPFFSVINDPLLIDGQEWICLPIGTSNSDFGHALIRINCTTEDWYNL